jgi:hypothetical protein
MAEAKQVKPKRVTKVSTQTHVNIGEIRNDTVIMKDGTLRAVLLVSSVNFNLKSEDEQNAIISSYITFLNSFDYSLEIVIQSRKLRIEAYLSKLWDIEKKQTNELLRVQMADYRSYVAELVELGEIMTKKFFVIVPMSETTGKEKGFFSQFFSLFSASNVISLSEKIFSRKKAELDQRVEHVRGGLQSMSLTTVRLDTQGLIELYYNVYNPDIAFNQPLPSVTKLRVEKE